jgi:hypothetical protein
LFLNAALSERVTLSKDEDSGVLVVGTGRRGIWYEVSLWKADLSFVSEISGAKGPRDAASLANVRLLPKARLMKSAIFNFFAQKRRTTREEKVKEEKKTF